MITFEEARKQHEIEEIEKEIEDAEDQFLQGIIERQSSLDLARGYVTSLEQYCDPNDRLDDAIETISTTLVHHLREHGADSIGAASLLMGSGPHAIETQMQVWTDVTSEVNELYRRLQWWSDLREQQNT